MTVKQVRFIYNDGYGTDCESSSGIYVDMGDECQFIICGCCGEIFDFCDFEEPDKWIQIIEEYEWKDLTETIAPNTWGEYNGEV